MAQRRPALFGFGSRSNDTRFKSTNTATQPFGTARSHEPVWLRALVANPSLLSHLSLLFAYAAICFDRGGVRISIRRGNAAAATGAVISSTPFCYSAWGLSASTPSGNVKVRSNFPYEIS